MKVYKLFLIISVLFNSLISYGYEVRTPEQFRMYAKGQYMDKATHQIITPMFKSTHERNHYVSEKYYCIQPTLNKAGYVYVKYTYSKTLVRQWENSLNGYSREPLRCDARYDKYTSFCTKQEAEQFKFTQDTLTKPHYAFNKCLYKEFHEFWQEPHRRNYL